MSRVRAHQPAARESRPGAAPVGDPTAIAGRTDIRSLALTVLAVIGSIAMLRYAQAVIIPIVLGVLISYALEPIVARLTRLRVARALAAALVLTAVAAGSGALLYQLRYEAAAIIEQLPDAAGRLRRIIERDGRNTASAIGQVQKAATELENAADAAAPPPSTGNAQRVQVEPPPIRVSEYVLWGSMSLFASGMQIVLVLFLSFFLLASGNLYRRKLVKIAGPSLEKKRVTLQILQEIDHQIERFLFVQLFTSTVVGVSTWLVFRWIGLEQAALWGLLAGVFNSIPYFGPVVVTFAVGIIAFLQFGTLNMVLMAAGAAFVITSLEGMLLTPLLTSRAARMNAVAVFVGLIFWGWVWEVWGVLLAVPMLMIVKAVCDRIEDLKPIGELLGD
jgi:predicted PurR-regulated permease PerM